MVTAAHEGGTEVCRTVTVNEGSLEFCGNLRDFLWNSVGADSGKDY